MVTLKRLDDDLERSSTEIKFIEFDKKGVASKMHDKPKVGYAAILAPFNKYFTWMTTVITEIISEDEFLTENSHYKIIKEK